MMKKRWMAATLVTAMIMSCTGGVMTAYADDSSSDDETVLTLWYWKNSIQEDLLEQVSEEFPGVKMHSCIPQMISKRRSILRLPVAVNCRIFWPWMTGLRICSSIRMNL